MTFKLKSISNVLSRMRHIELRPAYSSVTIVKCSTMSETTESNPPDAYCVEAAISIKIVLKRAKCHQSLPVANESRVKGKKVTPAITVTAATRRNIYEEEGTKNSKKGSTRKPFPSRYTRRRQSVETKSRSISAAAAAKTHRS
jgi:hypothetical protein